MRNEFSEGGGSRVITDEATAIAPDQSLTDEFFSDTPVRGEATNYEPSIEQINERAAQLDPYNEQPSEVVAALAREQLMAEYAQSIHDAEQARMQALEEERQTAEAQSKAEEWNAAYEALVSKNKNETQPLFDNAGLDDDTCTDLQLWENPDYLRGYSLWQLQELERKAPSRSMKQRATQYAPEHPGEDIRVHTTVSEDNGRKSGHFHVERTPSEERPNFDIHLIDIDMNSEKSTPYYGMTVHFKGKGLRGTYDQPNPDHKRFTMRISNTGKIEEITEILATTNETIRAYPGSSSADNPEKEKAEQMLYRLSQEFGVEIPLEAPAGQVLDIQATIIDLIERAAEDPNAMPIPRYKTLEESTH